ncbi:MAG: DUF222 domain-containing protein [Jatrophihabitantaceae bacterium]
MDGDWDGDGDLGDADLLACALAEHPAFRSGAELDRIDPGLLSRHERVDLLVVLEEQKRWFEAAQLRVLAVMQERDTSRLGLAQDSVSLALQVPLRTAQGKLAQARTLVRELPQTLAAVAGGAISGEHARVLAEALWRLPADPVLAPALEKAVLPALLDGRCVTVPQLRQRARRAALALDPVTAEERHRRALADRTLGYVPGEDGMASLPVVLAAPEAQLIYTRLTAAATLLPATDPRTMDQKRADLLVDAVLSGLPADALPVLRGRHPSINVTVSADTLLNLDDQPAHLTGYGPITAETARRLAADDSGTWRRLLTDPDTGALLDISADRYRPARRLRDFVSARDDVCAFPTCNQPGYRCEYEHTTPYSKGGSTCRCNGALACRRHNQCKHHTGWNYTHNSDGSFTWTTSTGHSYTSAPTTHWTSRQHQITPPTPPPPPTTEQLHAKEDAAYERLVAKLEQERKHATEAGNQDRQAAAEQALATAESDRRRQLTCRTDPNHPPF